MKHWHLTLLGVALCAALGTVHGAEKATATRVVQDGWRVGIEYTLKGEDGKLIESNKGKFSLVYKHGTGEMIPGLERALAGMRVGEEKHVVVKPQDAYGLVDFNKRKEVPKTELPPNAMKVGAEIARPEGQGRVRVFKVHEIREHTVVLDMNHPMAGKTLVFDVKVVDIQQEPSAPSAPAVPSKPAAPAQPNKPARPK
ncbi:MAG: peptidylprolyl isomerase [Deltaproteobacteria bacterium]|nr:peptidylprolyl isomerase [Deltaproteobacteria bacterium]